MKYLFWLAFVIPALAQTPLPGLNAGGGGGGGGGTGATQTNQLTDMVPVRTSATVVTITPPTTGTHLGTIGTTQTISSGGTITLSAGAAAAATTLYVYWTAAAPTNLTVDTSGSSGSLADIAFTGVLTAGNSSVTGFPADSRVIPLFTLTAGNSTANQFDAFTSGALPCPPTAATGCTDRRAAYRATAVVPGTNMTASYAGGVETLNSTASGGTACAAPGGGAGWMWGNPGDTQGGLNTLAPALDGSANSGMIFSWAPQICSITGISYVTSAAGTSGNGLLIGLFAPTSAGAPSGTALCAFLDTSGPLSTGVHTASAVSGSKYSSGTCTLTPGQPVVIAMTSDNASFTIGSYYVDGVGALLLNSGHADASAYTSNAVSTGTGASLAFTSSSGWTVAASIPAGKMAILAWVN